MMIGLKNRRVTFERPFDQPDELGDVGKQYVPMATVWASLEPIRGDERYQSQQVQASFSHRIRIRWSASLAGLTPRDRARYGSRTFDIVSVADINSDHREIELMVTERLS